MHRHHGGQNDRLALTAIGATTTHGQLNLRVVGGMGVSRIRNDAQIASSRGEEMKVDPRTSWLAGCEAHYQVTPCFSLNSGLLCTSYAGHDEYFINGSLYSETDRQLTYLLLPMLANFHWGSFHIGAGYQMGYLLDAGGTWSNYGAQYGGSDQTYELDPMPVVKTDMGVVGDLGCSLGDRWDLGVRYYQGFQNINDYQTGFTYTLLNQQALLRISFRIHPGRKTTDAGKDQEPAIEP